MLDHLALQCADVDAAADFYTRVFAPCGVRELMRFDEPGRRRRRAVRARTASRSCGSARWSTPGNRPVHLAIAAPSREAVDDVFAAAQAAGTEILHEPRIWPEYHQGYYGVFFRDPDGNNVEAVHHTFSA